MLPAMAAWFSVVVPWPRALDANLGIVESVNASMKCPSAVKSRTLVSAESDKTTALWHCTRPVRTADGSRMGFLVHRTLAA